MKKLLSILLVAVAVLAVIAVPKPANAQLLNGTAITNMQAVSLVCSSVNPIAVSRPNLIQRTIANTNTAVKLAVFLAQPIANPSVQYNALIATNNYNGSPVAVTNIPPNVIITSGTNSWPLYRYMLIDEGASSNTTLGSEMWGCWQTNGAGLLPTGQVITVDIYQQR